VKRALPYLAILLLALTLRAIHFVDWHDTPLFSILVGDARGYELWAQQIAAGDWFGHEVFYQAPLYPYFLATLQALFGDALWAARIAQIALGSAACVLLALAGRRFFSTRVGLVAGALLAVYAPAIYFEGLIQKATLGLFFICLLLFLLGEFSVRRSARWLAAAGLVIGCFALTRENALLLLPIACAWLVVGFRDAPAPQRVAWLAVLALGVTTVLVPVGLRNQALGDRFLVTTSQLGHNFYIGNHAGAVGRYTPLRKGRGGVRYERLDAIALAENALGRPLSPGEVSDYWLGQGLAWVRAAPGDWARLTARKWFLVWHRAEVSDTDSFEAYRDASWLLDALAPWFHFGALAPLALLGLWATRRDWRRLWLLYAMLLAVAASIAIFSCWAAIASPSCRRWRSSRQRDRPGLGTPCATRTGRLGAGRCSWSASRQPCRTGRSPGRRRIRARSRITASVSSSWLADDTPRRWSSWSAPCR
jgi:4-amino-4-deoxy-L-arabinose transferase-like glycosyltransferase